MHKKPVPVQTADSLAQLFSTIGAEVSRVVVGQQTAFERVLIGLLIDGHVLLEGPPGVAKTLLVRSIAQALHLSFERIQFTPDLLPADVTGTLVYNPKDLDFKVHTGPIFANLVLADEINRAPAKVQSALLEAMQERQVTLGGRTHVLPSPFMVLATQNPLEHEGTYPLPEAQLDRFALHVLVDYPRADEEAEVLARHLAGPLPELTRVAGPADLESIRKAARRIRLDARLQQYIVALVRATRSPREAGLDRLSSAIRYGVSPRAGVHLALAARVLAGRAGRDYVLPEDVKAIAPDVLRHRLILTYEAEADGMTPQSVLGQILSAVAVP